MQSLAFANMGTRSNLETGASGTGHWILDHDNYQAWQAQGGVLWIRGSAGCGKSVLMDFVVTHEQKQCRNSSKVVIPFFFHHADGGLHQSNSGLYRTILYHAFSNDKQALSTLVAQSAYIERRRAQGLIGTWPERELREHCKAVLQTLASKGRQVLIFSDAMDENGEGDTKRLLKEFRDLSVSTHRAINMCFSSREYLLVGSYYDLGLSVQIHNRMDISTFLDETLEAAELTS